MQIGENLLQELGIDVPRSFVPQKTAAQHTTPTTQKISAKQRHSSVEVLFDSDDKVRALLGGMFCVMV